VDEAVKPMKSTRKGAFFALCSRFDRVFLKMIDENSPKAIDKDCQMVYNKYRKQSDEREIE
jgi:hypothetical protein